MAIYTLINKSQLESHLAFYNLGELLSYSPIASGTTNSNYLVKTLKDSQTHQYVFTIIEENLSKQDLEFCIHYALHLKNSNIDAISPIADRRGLYYRKFLNKDALIVPYIEGENFSANHNHIKTEHCKLIGSELARMHIASISYSNNTHLRMNPAGISWCKKVNAYIEKNIDVIDKNDNNILLAIDFEINLIDNAYDLFIKNNKEILKDITGAIHADLFCDNVIFNKNTNNHDLKLLGIIDFYYSCTDLYIYDLAIVFNDWVFEYQNNNLVFDKARGDALLTAYFDQLKTNGNLYNKFKISIKETSGINMWSVVLRQAALRFWLLRLNAMLTNQNVRGSKPHLKNPKEYELKLEWHRKHKLNLDQFLV